MNGIEGQMEFFADDGRFPNSIYPVVIYRNVVPPGNEDIAEQLTDLFAANNWTNAWENGIYNYHHYHSTAHEVLGICSGSVKLHLGGEQGKVICLEAGDVVVIPAGVAHKNVHSIDLEVIGAYDEGREWDLLCGDEGERPEADEKIVAIPPPEYDPVQGRKGIVEYWNDWAVARVM